MELRELEAFISQQIEAAETFNNELGEHRAELYDRYMGKPYGDEEPDMSQVVSSDVSDTIEWIMPALMDIFTSTDEVVRFEPTGPEDEDAADQETAVINHIFHNKNNGFLVLHSAFKDALLAKNGIIKWRWEERERVEVIEHDKLTDEDLAQVISDLEERIGEEGEVEIIEQESTQVGMVPDPNVPIDDALMTGSMVPVMEHHIKIRARYTDGEIKVEPVAPEDFIISPRHNSVYVDGAPIVAHGIRTTVGDLLAQGYDYEVVSKLPVFDDDYDDLSNQRSRRHEDDSGIDQETLAWAGDAMRPVRVYECYVRVDYDGDGLPETRKVLTGGSGSGSILTRDGEPEIEEWQGPPPFANLTPILMSHKFHGRSIAELVEDLARIKTIILRQFLDNIYGTQNPSWELPLQAIGEETINDLMVQRAGGRVIRTEAPGMLREIAPPPLGQSLLAALEYVDTLRENRSGVTRYNQGLDASSLNKMLCIETPVPMADSSVKLLGDVEDGDEIVGRDGRLVTVVAAHEINLPNRAYELEFASGEKIKAGGEHLWTVQTPSDRRLGKERTIDTDAMAALVASGQKLTIPRVERVFTGDDIELPLDPYVLGVWLGDGHAYSPRVTTPEPEIALYLEAWSERHGGRLTKDKHQNAGKATTYYVGGLYKTLRNLRLMKENDESQEPAAIGKHIPEAYFSSSYEQRLTLLRGLMDSDGCAHSGAFVVFCQKEGRLLDDVVRLVKGLGWWPRLLELPPEGRFDHVGKHYQLFFTSADCPFSLPRKAKKWAPPQRNVNTQYIRSIKEIALRPMRCLTVDAPDGLFCVGELFTVTHNTASGINAILTASQQKIQLIARVFAETGLKALFRGLHQSLRFYARRELAMKLRNQWVTVDPSHWRERTDLVVNVGLGMGTKDQRIQHLLAILDIQKEGKAAQSPLVNDSKIFNTLEKLVEAVGLKSADMFFVNPDEQGGEPQQPQGDPAVMAMAKAEEAKLAWEQQKFTAEQQFKMAELRLEDDRKRDEFEAETLIKIAEMQGLPITMDDAMAYMSRNRAPRAEQAPAQTVQPQGVVM